jgi:hypothetical protein
MNVILQEFGVWFGSGVTQLAVALGALQWLPMMYDCHRAASFKISFRWNYLHGHEGLILLWFSASVFALSALHLCLLH